MTKQMPWTDECDVALAMSVIGGKWMIAIIWALVERPYRFGELRREIVGISEGVLIAQLKELERNGIVYRHSYDEVPPRVDYSLTAQGRGLEQALRELDAWGATYRRSLAESAA